MAGDNFNVPAKFALDASLGLAFLLPDEKTRGVKHLFRLISEGRVCGCIPEIFYYEVGNGLKSAVLRKRITAKKAQFFLERLQKFPLKIVEINRLKTLETAILKNVSFYDAAYLSLAQQYKIALISLDNLMSKIQKAEEDKAIYLIKKGKIEYSRKKTRIKLPV